MCSLAWQANEKTKKKKHTHVAISLTDTYEQHAYS